MVDYTIFALLPTAMVCASLYTLLSYLMVYYVYVEIYKHAQHKVSYHDYRGYIDHVVEDQSREFLQTLTNSSMWIFNLWYQAFQRLYTYLLQYRYVMLGIVSVSFLAFVLSHQGHVILRKFDMLYEDMHDAFVYGVKIIIHTLSLVGSAVVGFYDMMVILSRGVSSIATKLLLKLGVNLIIEGAAAIANFFSDFTNALYQWLVVDGFVDGDPNFLRVFLSLQRSLWVSRELLIEPCDMLRNFWESALAPSSYYPPKGARVRLNGYYFPEPEILPEYEAFNKWCYSQNLTGVAGSSDTHIPELSSYDPDYTYCAMCDYDGGVRKNCVPFAYNFALALNSVAVFACKTIQMPVHYLLRSRSVIGSISETLTDRGPRRKAKEVADFVFHLRGYGTAVAQPSDSRERFFTGDGVEMKYCVCWNSYAGYDSSHSDGVPVDTYLHHAPWLLCPSYAEGYRTYDMDGLFTAYIDATGFMLDAADEWYLSVFNYLQYVMIVDVTGMDVEVGCEELWTVPKATYNETSGVCHVTPPALMALSRHVMQGVGGVARMVGRCVAYIPTLLYELGDTWADLVDGSSSDDHNNQEGLSHQLLETPNTIGCLRQDEAEYPSTTSREGGSADAEHYCARNYVIDSTEGFMHRFADVVRSVHLEKEADVIRSSARAIAGKLRFSYRLAMVSLFGPYQTPPAPPAYPAPPAPPPFPPPGPKCYVPAVRVTNLSGVSNPQFQAAGLEAWTAYECGIRQNNPMASYSTHLRASEPDSNYSFIYRNKRWAYNEAPTDLAVDCFFVSAYDAYRSNGETHDLCPVPDGHEEDADADMCTLAGYPSPHDNENVDTSNLRTSPNVFTFSDADQEQCLCDDDNSHPVDERTLYTCPTSSWHAPRRTRLDDLADTLLSYLVSARRSGSAWDASLGYYTREGEMDVPYPVCRGLQVTLLDRPERNVSYDFLARTRCSMSPSEYTDGLVSEGYGVQVECSLVAITDIANDTVRRAATFIISDEAKVMRLPVRLIRRRLNSEEDEAMLSASVDLLAQGPSWTARAPEQAFNGSLSQEADPAWNEFMSVGGTGAGMHQPLCSCDPSKYVPPTPVREVRHCAPRVFQHVPPPPSPPESPTWPPPPYPAYPPLTNDTVCRNSAGELMKGFYMRYHPRDVFPATCVCEYSGFAPVSSHNGDSDDTVYCPDECDDSSTAEGPTCVCRVRDITDLERVANGDRAVPFHNDTDFVESGLRDAMDALNALAVDVASPEADLPEYDPASQGKDLEYAFSFDFEREVDRFPILHRATTSAYCEDHLGVGWTLHNLNEDEQTSANDFRKRLQAVVDSRINDWKMSATGASFMDAHPLCADRYRVAMPPRFDRFYVGNVNGSVRREVVGPARQAWRLASPRNLRDAGRYTADDSEFLSEAMYARFVSASGVASSDFTPGACQVADTELANMPSGSDIDLLASPDGSVYHLFNVSANKTCATDEEVTFHKGSQGTYSLRCGSRVNNTAMYTAADAHNRRFDRTTALTRRARFTLNPRSTAYGFMHYVNAEGRVSLLNQTDRVTSGDDCALRFAYADTFSMRELRDSHSRVCEMYADESYLHNGLSADQHPKARYAHAGGALLRRHEVNGGHSACSIENASDTQVLCHDANLLTPEQMAQAATFCGFSVASESVQASNARTGCRSIPYGFVLRQGTSNNQHLVFYPIMAPSDAVGGITDPAARKVRVGMPVTLDNAEGSHLYDRGHRVVPVCSRRVSNVTRTRITSVEGATERSSDGRAELTHEVLRAARTAVDTLRSRSAKCALNALRTFPYLDAPSTERFRKLYESARPNAVERLLASDLAGSTSKVGRATRDRTDRLERSEASRETRRADPLFEFGGYLFENDVHLSHGATTDAKVTVDDNVVAGDFDAMGNVGLFGMSTRENGHLPRVKIEDEFPIGHKGRPRSYNRQLFTRLDGSRDPDTFCTRRRDDFDNVTVFEVPPHPQDAKVDVGDCDVLDRKVYNNWAKGYPTHGLGVDREGLEATFIAGTFDCVALNVLSGSHCAVHSESSQAPCALGRDVTFAEWVTLPCAQKKPFVCSKGGGDYHTVTKPLGFEAARLYCKAYYGEEYDLSPPPSSAGGNGDLARLARNALCSEGLLDAYGGARSSVCSVSAFSASAEVHTAASLEGLTKAGCGTPRQKPLDGYVCCNTTSALLIGNFTGGANDMFLNAVGSYGQDGACTELQAGSHARGSFYANEESITFEDAIAGGSAWNLQFGDVWIGYRRHTVHAGFSEQRFGVCDTAPDAANPVLLRRLDTAWNASDDAAIPSFFPDSKEARHMRTLASRSNRRSLWYPSVEATRDEILSSDMQTDDNNILASQGWLYTCAGRTLKFEPAASLDNPPYPSAPHAPVLTDLQNTNQGRFQVSAGGVLTQVASTGETLLRRDISEAYVVSHARSSVETFQRAVDEHQPYRPQSAYNTYTFTGVEALSAAVQYGASERSSETVSDCETTSEHDPRACELYLEDAFLKGEMSDQRAKVDMRITRGASEANDQHPALDLHYVGGPRLRLPSDYTSGWQDPEKNVNKKTVDLWIKGYSFNETGICGPKDTVRAYHVDCDSVSGRCSSYTTEPLQKCAEEAERYLETTAISECGSYEQEAPVDDEPGLNSDPVLLSFKHSISFDSQPFNHKHPAPCNFDSVSIFNITRHVVLATVNMDRDMVCGFDAAITICENQGHLLAEPCKSVVRAQRFGVCDTSGTDAVATSMLFEVVPCKDDADAHVSGEFSIVGKDATGRDLVLALHQAGHPFDSRAVGVTVATQNAEAFLHAVNKNRTRHAPGSLPNASVILNDYATLFEEESAEHPLRPSVWTSRGSALKLLDPGYRAGVSVANVRSGRCFESPSSESPQLHNVSVVTCSADQNCGTVQFSVRVAVRTGLTLLPTDGETSEELLQNLYPDLSLERPRMRSRRTTSSRYRRALPQAVTGEALFNWTRDANATLSSDVFGRDGSLRARGSLKPFALNTSYSTRGAADTALQPGDRLRSLVFGGLHASADVSGYSARRGVVDFRTYLHALNSTTYPCNAFSETDDTFAYDVCTEVVAAGLSPPQIADVVGPSNCGVIAERSDSRCTLLALLT
eukprot:gene588-989_t